MDLDDSSVVITGKNGIGKTNILEAICCLLKAKASEMQNRFSNED
nr:AAA family ATPase [Wolbachia endosymbiont of Litomosoides brasiliensis]